MRWAHTATRQHHRWKQDRWNLSQNPIRQEVGPGAPTAKAPLPQGPGHPESGAIKGETGAPKRAFRSPSAGPAGRFTMQRNSCQGQPP